MICLDLTGNIVDLNRLEPELVMAPTTPLREMIFFEIPLAIHPEA